jgi:RNA polymerase sigma-70 factor (sigma-E family)
MHPGIADHPGTGKGFGRAPYDFAVSLLGLCGGEAVSEVREPRFGAGYEFAAGLKRYRSWLGDHTEDAMAQDATPTEPFAAIRALMPDALPEWSADHAVVELYSLQYRSLVRLAAMLVRDTPTAEEVVQDAFVAMHAGWHRLKDTDKALAYLRQAVVNKARSVLRHRMVVEKNLQTAQPDMPSAEHGAFALLKRSAVIAALRTLPERQREAIVLRYYADLSEAEIAATMGISRGSVKSHTSRGIAALRAALEQELWREPGTAPRLFRHSGTTSSSSSVVRCTPWRTRLSRTQKVWNGFARGSGPGRARGTGALRRRAARDRMQAPRLVRDKFPVWRRRGADLLWAV